MTRRSAVFLNAVFLVLFIKFLNVNAASVTQLSPAPRCAFKDNFRSKRFALQGSKWEMKHLTYRISKYSTKLHKFDVDREIAKAFALWSQHTDLTFSPKFSGPVNIDIRFESFNHKGKVNSSDGPRIVLAQAKFPSFGGGIYFDDAEQWTINSRQGINLFQVAAHQIGHSLGLGHSTVRWTLMSPLYRGYDPKLKLHIDDIQAIQALYGKKPPEELIMPSKLSEALMVPESPHFCDNTTIDAIFSDADGATIVFKGESYYRLQNNKIVDGFPKAISEGWPGLPGHIDAAFTYKNGKTYFFKGSKYWRYDGRKVDGDYPKKISGGFTGIPSNVDAAFVLGPNRNIYFVKGNEFWQFDPIKRPPVESTYPKSLRKSFDSGFQLSLFCFKRI